MVFPPLSPPQRPHFLSCDKHSVTFPAAVVNFPTRYISARAKAKQRKPATRLPLFVFTLCFGTELVFADAAQRADPIFGDGFPRRAGGDAVVGVAGCGVVDVAADVTDVFHGCVSRYGKLLAEVALEQTLERLAVAGLNLILPTKT